MSQFRELNSAQIILLLFTSHQFHCVASATVENENAQQVFPSLNKTTVASLEPLKSLPETGKSGNDSTVQTIIKADNDKNRSAYLTTQTPLQTSSEGSVSKPLEATTQMLPGDDANASKHYLKTEMRTGASLPDEASKSEQLSTLSDQHAAEIDQADGNKSSVPLSSGTGTSLSENKSVNKRENVSTQPDVSFSTETSSLPPIHPTNESLIKTDKIKFAKSNDSNSSQYQEEGNSSIFQKSQAPRGLSEPVGENSTNVVVAVPSSQTTESPVDHENTLSVKSAMSANEAQGMQNASMHFTLQNASSNTDSITVKSEPSSSNDSSSKAIPAQVIPMKREDKPVPAIPTTSVNDSTTHNLQNTSSIPASTIVKSEPSSPTEIPMEHEDKPMPAKPTTPVNDSTTHNLYNTSSITTASTKTIESESSSPSNDFSSTSPPSGKTTLVPPSDKPDDDSKTVHQFFSELRAHTVLCLISLLLLLLVGTVLFSFVLAIFFAIKYSVLGLIKLCELLKKFPTRKCSSSVGLHDSGSLFPRCDVSIGPYQPSSRDDRDMY